MSDDQNPPSNSVPGLSPKNSNDAVEGSISPEVARALEQAGSQSGLWQDIASAIEENEARRSSVDGSSKEAATPPVPPPDHGPLPKSWAEATPQIIWIVLVLAFGFVFADSVAQLFENPVRRALFGLVAMVGLTAMVIYRAWLRERFKTLSGGSVLAAIIVLLLVLTSGPLLPLIGTATTPASVAPTLAPGQKLRPEYLKNITFGSDDRRIDGPGQLGAAKFGGVPTVTKDRLRVFVDYSYYYNGWMPKRRVEIGEIKEPVVGKQVSVPFISWIGSTGLWWGNPELKEQIPTPDQANATTGSSAQAVPIRGRLAIIDQTGEEQHYYFTMLRFPDQHPTRFMIPRGPESDWISDWEKEAEK